MTRPPQPTKATAQGKPISYFMELFLQVRPLLDKHGISLSFDGYLDMINDISNLSESNTAQALQLAKECLEWSSYFSEAANLIQVNLLNAETDKIAIIANASLSYDPKTVAKGDRMANKDEVVVQIRKSRNVLKALHEELASKKAFFEKAHYLCKGVYDAHKKANSGLQFVT